MCYNVSYQEKRASKLAVRYNHVFKPNWQLRVGDFLAQTTSYLIESDKIAQKIHIENWEQTIDQVELPTYFHANAFRHPKLVVIIADGIFDAEWGLYPGWAGEDFDNNKTANARSEEAKDKKSYKGVLYKRRGILPVNSIFEFRKLYGASNKPKDTVIIPYRIYGEEEFLSVGVLWDIWKPGNPELAKDKRNWRITFTMLTTKANSLMEQIHNDGERMPIFLNREDEKQWLNMNASEAEVQALLAKPYAGKLNAYTVSREINNTKNTTTNRPDILNHVKYNIPEIVY